MDEHNRKIRKQKEKNKKKLASHLLTAAIIGLATLVIYQVYTLGSYYYDLWKNTKTAEMAREIFTGTLTANPPAAPGSNETEASAPAEGEPAPNPGLLALREQFANEDIFAYIYIDDTNISYPVVQGEDDEFYLRHDLYKKNSAGGSIFMSASGDREFSHKNSVLFGHNMKNGSMFHDLRYYSKKEFYESHKYIVIAGFYETTTWEIFAAYDTGTNFDYIRGEFSSQEDFMDLVNKFKENTPYDTGVEVSPEDKIVTLSTCSYVGNDMRFAVHGKLIKTEVAGGN